MENQYNRRKFIKDSMVTSVGAALMATPLEIFATIDQPAFNRSPNSPFYFPSAPYPDCQVFVLAEPSFKKSQFSFTADFNNLDLKFLVGFYKGPNLAALPEAVQRDYASRLSGSYVKRYIMWISSFDVNDLDLANSINIADPPNLEINFTLGTMEQVDEEYKVKLINPSLGYTSVRFDEKAYSIIIENQKDFIFFANGQRALFKQISIPLAAASKPGSLQFSTHKFVAESIKPYSPYFSKRKKDSVRQILKVSYFEESSFKDGVNLQVLLYPFAVFTNDTLPASYITFIQSKPVFWNGVNEYGIRLMPKDFNNFSARLAVLKFEGETDTMAKFMFIPWNKLTLMPQPGNNSQHLLLGYTGTERIAIPPTGLEVIFSRSEFLLVSDDGQKLLKAGGSITSKQWFAPQIYHLDAERAPLFENMPAPGLPANNNKSVKYRAIAQGTLSADRGNVNLPVPEALILPLIPMFGFNDQPKALDEFIELEKVFMKIRLNKFKPQMILPQSKANSFVTPQGFLKDRAEKKYNFIKIDDKPKEIPDIVFPAGKDVYRFSINGIDSDFNLSISKEEVFFVLTPSLLRAIHSTVTLDVFFGIHGFDIDLRFKTGQHLEAGERVLVFKYSRHSVEELMKDPSKWSNWGIYKGSDASVLNDLSGTIKNKFNDLETKYNQSGPKGPNSDYYYADQVIRRDPNWNGVFILNIPIADNDDLPAIFTGLTASQNLHGETDGDKLALNNTTLNFNYVAFPVNKTAVAGDKIEIKSTSFYGLIDYDIFVEKAHPNEPQVKAFLEKDGYHFILSRLLVRFENSEIRNFKSYVFLKIHNLFEDAIEFKPVVMSNADSLIGVSGPQVVNCVRLEGSYQKNSAGADQFTFDLKGDIEIKIPQNIILKGMTIYKASFSFTSKKDYRFDFDGIADFESKVDLLEDVLSFDSVEFKNFGLAISLDGLKLPSINFDISRFFVLPKINFGGGGFLSNFPFQFSRFQVFSVPLSLKIPDFDFLDIPIGSLKPNCSLWSMVFNFDLGTLGDLSFLKALKGEFLFGWSKGGGLKFGLKLNGPSDGGLHINLFGALKLDIRALNICSIKIDNKNHFLLRLVDARLTILGLQLPSEKDEEGNKIEFDGFLFASPHTRTAWLLGYYTGNLLSLGVGQGVGPSVGMRTRTVDDCFSDIRNLFRPGLNPCQDVSTITDFYQPVRNWLVASENFIPKDWKSVLDMKFIFNDPDLYGVYLKIADLFSIDILYKKLSDSLGIWSLEFALDPSIRTIDAGELVITLPNLGIDISTNGDWKLDIGFPKVNDWSRSCMIQFRPFVGWAGMYLAKINTVALSLFAPYIKDVPQGSISIIQTGFAVRIGIGAYMDKGVFYVGASISVYGIMEGAFGFDKVNSGLKQLLPNHFVLSGRIGAIAELVGYVDFKIVKAVLHIVLRVELGMTIALIKGKLQPVPLYIEGEVSVELDFTICCFSVFGHHICITIHLSFHAFVRFEYILGNNSNSQGHLLPDVYPSTINGGIEDIPIIFIPAFTKSRGADNNESCNLIYNFGIPFFGIAASEGKLTDGGEQNLISEAIITPMFKAILKAFNKEAGMHYSQLRDVLLNSRLNGKPEIEFAFPDFTPTFLIGFDRPANTDSPDYHDYKEFIHTYFKLSDQNNDIDNWFNNTSTKPCENNDGKCPYRIIPVPISSKIKVVKKGDSGWSPKTGFSITVDTILPVKKTKKFEAGDPLNSTQLLEAKKQFDSYKTQFNDLQESGSTVGKLDVSTYSLKDDVLTSEYFRLIGLLVLEMYYNFLADMDSNRKGKEAFDPYITSSKIIADGDWKLNAAGNIEKLIGQLNYFYNNGLRLADFKSPTTSKAFFEMLNQSEVIDSFNDKNVIDKFANGLDANNQQITYDKVVIQLDSLDTGGNSINLAGELFPTQSSLNSYLKNAIAPLQIDFGNMEGQFNDGAGNFKGSIISPFELVDLKIAILNSSLGSTVMQANGPAIAYRADDFKFFEVPKLVAEVFDNSKQLCNINLFSLTTGTRDQRLSDVKPIVVNKVVCTNIEVRVKVHLENGLTTSLEFADVLIEDLYLADQLNDYLKVNPNAIRDIAIYKKDDDLKVHALPLHGLKILKTNISSKTHPPIIIDKGNLVAADPSADTIYYAEITDIPNFTRLFWEGLTTNYGGFYLFNDITGNTSFGDFNIGPNPGLAELVKLTQKQFALIVSFEANAAVDNIAIPGFNNYLKVVNNQLTPTLFADLDAKSQYLYTSITTVNPAGEVITVKQYHATIPAHCFGFELERKGQNTDFGQYLPVDYQLTAIPDTGESITIQDWDKVFPIMPKNKKVNKDVRMIDTATDMVIKDSVFKDIQFYNHIMPVAPYAKDTDLLQYDPHLINRYTGVSSKTKYSLKFSVRDIYGFRAFQLPKLLNYGHVYFDKLIPVSAWPFIKFSYWCDDPSGDVSWKLKVEFFDDESDKHLNQGKEQIEKQLYTIKAQVSDPNCKFSVLPQFIKADQPGERKDIPRDQLLAIVDQAIRLSRREVLNTQPVNFTVGFNIQSQGLKTLLSPYLEIKRVVSDDLFVKLPQVVEGIEALEFNSVKWLQTTLTLVNNDKIDKTDPAKRLENSFKALNTLLSGGNSNFTIGVGLDKHLRKVNFLVNKNMLNVVTKDAKFNRAENFYGIRPYSNKLWSGDYTPTILPVNTFTDVDLDDSLKTVLSTIDKLLSPSNINHIDPALLNKLVNCKKKLVKGGSEIADPSTKDAELSSKLEKIDEAVTKTSNEFENFLLEKLSNFYDTDGVLINQLGATPGLTGHRLTINVKNDPGYAKYNIQSSKLDYRKTDSPEWTILFDYIANNADSDDTLITQPDPSKPAEKDIFYDLLITPEITHIEYDIVSAIDIRNGIEESKWIQLITPLSLNQVSVSKFPAIIRQYPPNPIISTNKAEQSAIDNTSLPWSKALGKWFFNLGIKDIAGQFGANDRIVIALSFKSLIQKGKLDAVAPPRNFEGFIAYWSAQITKQTLDTVADKKPNAERGANIRNFITELDTQLCLIPAGKQVAGASVSGHAEDSQVTITLRRDAAAWVLDQIQDENCAANNSSCINLYSAKKVIVLPNQPVTIDNMFIGEMNIFEAPYYVSVKPALWVSRNENVNNPNFRYKTAIVTPPSWTTVHLKFAGPIFIKNNLQGVFDTVSKKGTGGANIASLPFKANLKHLIGIHDLSNARDLKVPAIPIEYMEFAEGSDVPSGVDNKFKGYFNGNAALGITISNTENDSKDLNNLTVFDAFAIIRK